MNKRYAVKTRALILAGVLTLSAIAGGIVYAQRPKTIHLTYNGQAIELVTSKETLQEALTEKGEFAFVIGPAAAPSAWTDEEVIRTLREKQEQGISAKQAMKEIVAASGRSRNEVYQLREEDRSAEK